jgi:hypothetical protein
LGTIKQPHFSKGGNALALKVRNLLLVAGLLLTASAAQAQTLFSDNFNSEPSVLNYVGFANWTVSGGTVDTFTPYAGFGVSVDMDGSTGNAGILTTNTTFNLTPGNYILSFALGKNGGTLETMTVSIGSAFSEVFQDSLSYPTPTTVTRPFSVGATVNAPLVFDHAGGNNQGYIIDNVSLVRVVAESAAPEPTSLALLLAGGIGIALRRRRSR